MDKFELQKLRDLPIEGVAGRLGLEVVKHKCLCPFHDDHHASLSFSVRRNTYRCFACGAHGGVIDLAMGLLNKDFKDACRWLADEHNRPLSSSPREGRELPSLTGGVGGGSFDATRYARFFEHPWLSPEARKFLFEERRIDPRVVRYCRLSSYKDRDDIPWMSIPYYSRDGELIGVQRRNLIKGSQPRFKFAMGCNPTIYNLPVLNRLRNGDELYIAEGSSDAWSLLSAGHKAIAIPSATLLSPKDVELLQALSHEQSIRFMMHPDNDAPGARLASQLQTILPNLVIHQLPPDCKDFSDYYVQNRRAP